MECNRCGTDAKNIEYFKDEYSDEVICEDCLLEIDGITTDSVTNYFLDGDFIGDSNEIDVVINSICDNVGYQKIETNNK